MSSIHLIRHTHIQSGSGASVTIYGMSRTEGAERAGTDPMDLQLPRGAADSSRNADNRANDTTVDDTSNTVGGE